MTSLRNAAIASALLLTSCLAVLGLMEITVRLFFPEVIQPRFVRDSGFGIRDNEPNIRMRHYSPSDYEVEISTNSDGLRGTKEYNQTASAGTRRVAILGDSFAFGYGCNDNQVVSAVLEDLLNRTQATGTTRWEVPNFGVSGYGQAEELVLYRNKVRRYHPDVDVLFYFDNDIGNNAVADIFAVGKDGTIVPTGKSFLPGSTTEQRMYRVPPLRWLFVHSEAWNLLRNRLSGVIQNRWLRRADLKDYYAATPGAGGSMKARSLTRALIIALSQEVMQDGAWFIIVVIPDKTLSSNFPFSKEESEAMGLTVVDGREFVRQDDYYQHDDHWKPSGHRKTAEVLVSVLTGEKYPGSKHE